jgi:peptide/nickel transport system permease protein
MTAFAAFRGSAAPSLRTALRSIGFAGLGLIAVVVSLGDVIARLPPGSDHVGPPLSPPSVLFAFGTDLFGRDMVSETLHALAVSVDMAAMAMLVAIVAGGLAGFVAARLPWGLGLVMRWIVGVLTSLPALFLAILCIGLSARGYAPLYAGLAGSPLAFVRAFDRARELGSSPHAEFARATGVSAMSLIRRDLTYEFRAGFLAVAARALAAVTIILSTVSFFGFGSAPPNRDLGLMIAASRETYVDAWWTATFPAIALALLILFARLAAGLEEGERP